jgi:hypothetical protein
VLQQTPFSGDHGVQYRCEMAVALFQKVPKEREKQDPYMGTYKEGGLSPDVAVYFISRASVFSIQNKVQHTHRENV